MIKPSVALGALALTLGTISPSLAATVIVDVNDNLLTAPFTFMVEGVSFTLSASNDIFAPLVVSNGPEGAFSSVFGSPSSSFVNRGTVQYGPDVFGSYSSFLSPTSVNFSNGDNFLGIRATVGADDFYGFVYTTDNVLNSYGFETVANTTITATTASAVPEPSTWALMLLGFGGLGAFAYLQSRRNTLLPAMAA